MMTSSRSSSARVAESAHAVDLLVDRGVLFYVGVGARDIRFRLVIVVIADEILDRVVGEEALELAIELGGERLVRCQDDGGPLRRLDHLGHGVGLAGAGHAEQHLRAVVAVDALDQLGDRGWLVAARLIMRLDLEAHAAFGLFRARRPMRGPHPGGAVVLAELRPALADQRFQRVGGGLDAERPPSCCAADEPGLRHRPLPSGGRADAPVPDRASVSWPRFRNWPAAPRRSPRRGRRAAADWAAAALASYCPAETLSASRPARDARRPRLRSGDRANCPAAAAVRCPIRARHRRD
ncbi:hypothetical protein ACVWZV_002925 [Bradyrhizobium sp. GM5.1]